MTDVPIALSGVGYAVGSDRRDNDSPAYKWLRDNVSEEKIKQLFDGYKYRAVLAENETITDLMCEASTMALNAAGLDVEQVDMITGYATVSEYLTPNALSELHQILGARSNCWVLPVQSEYTNYLLGIALARAFIHSGQAQHVLVVAGCNWTRHVDYHEPPAVSVGDAASAAVISRGDGEDQFQWVDAETLSDTRWYGSMSMKPRQISAEETTVRLGAYTKPVFNLNVKSGIDAFKNFGMSKPPELALSLLERHGVPASKVTLIAHQASSVLMNAWKARIQPAAYLDTLEEFGNMTLASIGVTLAHRYFEIETEYLLLLGIGVQQETSAVLLRRPRCNGE
ncbi:MAG: 3-oxoacyl-ACP synthase III family protein [Congregibacter sp.]